MSGIVHSQQELLACFSRKKVELRNREFLTDVTVVCGTRLFPAHAIILCAGSSFFENAFETIQENFQGQQMDLPTVSADAFEIVLDFLYNGQIPPEIENNPRKLTDVLGASHTLQIPDLYQFCIKGLENMLSFQYFTDLWCLSEQYDETEMLNRVIEFVAINFLQTSTCVDFFKLSLYQLTQVLQHPRLDRLRVDAIVRGILEWVKYEYGTRRDGLHSLVSAFDVTLLSTDCLKVLLNSEPIVKDNKSLYDKFVATASTRLATPRPAGTTVGPTTRFAVGSTPGPKLYCFGKIQNVSVVSVFNKRTLTWSTNQALTIPLSEGVAIAAHNNNLYFVGGGETASHATNTISEYSPVDWHLISLSTMQSEVWKPGVAVLDNKMYIVGGLNRQSAVTNTVQCFDFDNRSCRHVARTNINYCVPIVASTANYLLVVGSSFRTTVEKFNPSTGQWTVVWPNHLPGMSPRAATSMQQLYVVSDVLDRKFRIFNPETDDWIEENFVGGPDEIRGMWNVDRDDGGSPCIIVRDGRKALFSYSLDTNEWQLLANSTNIPWNWWQTVMIPE